jgi:hypothetical protein
VKEPGFQVVFRCNQKYLAATRFPVVFRCGTRIGTEVRFLRKRESD